MSGKLDINEVRSWVHDIIETCYIKDWIWNGEDEMPVTYFNRELAETKLTELIGGIIDLASRNP